ncbi:MAG: 5'/3'-nucleotidase SurE [Opitutales bacterium]
MAQRPHFLLTNDDGICSHFLGALAHALAERGRVSIVAPAFEQSWIGRAITRHNHLEVTETNGLPGRAFAVSGTPTDCVNLALAHLLADDPPDLVCSGINVGFNCSMPILLSSGTFAGAVEGAAWGKPAAAFSLAVAQAYYEARLSPESPLDELTAASLNAAAGHASNIAAELASEASGRPAVVHNVNFPANTTPETPIEATQPMWVPAPGWFQPVEAARYAFEYPAHALNRQFSGDIGAVLGGKISHSRIDLSSWSDFNA